MVQVQTARGLVDRERLEAKDVATEDEDSRVTVTEWYLEGELVRRDVWVSLLRGLAAVAGGGTPAGGSGGE
jgi:hypothetical protein